MVLKNCDKSYEEPACVINYDASDNFHQQKWVLPPKDQLDRPSSIPAEIRDEFTPGGYENGENSQYTMVLK